MHQKPIELLNNISNNNQTEIAKSNNNFVNVNEQSQFFISPDGKSFRTELAIQVYYARDIKQEVIDEYGKEEFQKFLSRFSQSSKLHVDNVDSFLNDKVK